MELVAERDPRLAASLNFTPEAPDPPDASSVRPAGNNELDRSVNLRDSSSLETSSIDLRQSAAAPLALSQDISASPARPVAMPSLETAAQAAPPPAPQPAPLPAEDF